MSAYHGISQVAHIDILLPSFKHKRTLFFKGFCAFCRKCLNCNNHILRHLLLWYRAYTLVFIKSAISQLSAQQRFLTSIRGINPSLKTNRTAIYMCMQHGI